MQKVQGTAGSGGTTGSGTAPDTNGVTKNNTLTNVLTNESQNALQDIGTSTTGQTQSSLNLPSQGLPVAGTSWSAPTGSTEMRSMVDV